MGAEFYQKLSFYLLRLSDGFIFQFANMVYHIDWFVCIEESLHPWNKLNLIIVCELFSGMLNSVCWNFVEDFCIYFHKWYWPIIFFFCDTFIWFWYQGDGGLIKWVWKCSFLCNFLEEFQKDRRLFFSKCLLEFTCAALFNCSLRLNMFFGQPYGIFN